MSDFHKGGLKLWITVFGAALDVALMKVQHMKQIAKMARITPAVTLATLKASSLAHQMLSDLMRKNKRELDLRRRIKENTGVRP